jgi:hypothetical protein
MSSQPYQKHASLGPIIATIIASCAYPVFLRANFFHASPDFAFPGATEFERPITGSAVSMVIIEGMMKNSLSALATAIITVSFRRCSSRLRTNGKETAVWVRWTDCFRKINGKWLIKHERVSAPLFMDGSNRAEADLKL